jgi:hypothetical protein
MTYSDQAGKARTDPRRPRAFGVCDQCGTWFNLRTLRWGMEYMGPGLQRTGFRVCSDCFDQPQDQLRPIILPPDPMPVADPRVEVAAIVTLPIGIYGQGTYGGCVYGIANTYGDAVYGTAKYD